MKKIIAILSAFLLPVVSFAQSYGFRMMDYGNKGYGYGEAGSGCLMPGLMSFLFIIPMLGGVVVVALFIFWVLMLVDAIKNSSEKMKIAWVLVIIFTHIVGAFIYYFVEKRPRDQKGGHEHSDK